MSTIVWLVILAVLSGVVGYFVAKQRNVNPLKGVLIGVASYAAVVITVFVMAIVWLFFNMPNC